MSLLVYLVTQCNWWLSDGCLMFVRAPCARVILLVVTGCVSPPSVRLCTRMLCALFNGKG